MTATIKMKTAELTGRALDWAVCMAVGWNPVEYRNGMLICSNMPGDEPLAAPSTSWAQCGPLIDRYSVHVNPPFCGSVASAYVETGTFGGAKGCTGKTTLEAICRSIVISQIGAEIDIPAELLS